VAGVVLNRTGPVDDPSVPHNAAEIERLTGAKVLASLPFLRDIAARPQAIRSALAGKVQF
jgi:dethiobiotin synthetase